MTPAPLLRVQRPLLAHQHLDYLLMTAQMSSHRRQRTYTGDDYRRTQPVADIAVPSTSAQSLMSPAPASIPIAARSPLFTDVALTRPITESINAGRSLADYLNVMCSARRGTNTPGG